MDEHFAIVGSRGRVAISAGIRHYLDLKPGYRISFDNGNDNVVHIRRVRYPTVASLRSAAGSLGRDLSKAETMAIVRDDRAEAILRKVQRESK